ncbi:MAG: hypothetical protein ACYC75_03670 [Minisyncoccota bacterium]
MSTASQISIMPPQEQTSNTMTRNIWTGVVIVVALLLLAWWYIASISKPIPVATPQTINSRPGLVQSDIRGLSGTVTAINGSNITLHVVSNIPFDASLSDRTILIASSTKIVVLVPKDPKVFQSEMADFTNQVPSKGMQLVAPPKPFTQAPTNLSNIKIGTYLIVFSSENIKTLKTFTATVIAIQQSLPS